MNERGTDNALLQVDDDQGGLGIESCEGHGILLLGGDFNKGFCCMWQAQRSVLVLYESCKQFDYCRELLLLLSREL